MTNGWHEVELGSICELFDGPHATPEKTASGPIFLGISSLDRGGLNLAESEHLSEEDFGKWTRRVTPQAGDVVFSYETRIGEAALIPEGLQCCLGRRMGLLRPNKSKVDPRFLLYAYLGPHFQDTLRSRTIHGSTVERLALLEVPKFPIRLPSVSQQRAIASILGALDDKIELNRRMNEMLEAIAQTLFKKWFVDAVEDGLPRGWRTTILNEVSPLIIDHRGKTPKKLGGDWSEFGIPAISAKNIKRGRLVQKDAIKFVDRELYLRWMRDELKSGDVLLTSEAPLGEALYVLRGGTFCLSQRIFALRADPLVCASTYLYLWLRSETAQRELAARATGTTVVGIRQSELRALQIPLPPLELQMRAHGTFESLLRRMAANEDENGTLGKLRDGLLPKLLSGELSV